MKNASPPSPERDPRRSKHTGIHKGGHGRASRGSEDGGEGSSRGGCPATLSAAKPHWQSKQATGRVHVHVRGAPAGTCTVLPRGSAARHTGPCAAASRRRAASRGSRRSRRRRRDLPLSSRSSNLRGGGGRKGNCPADTEPQSGRAAAGASKWQKCSIGATLLRPARGSQANSPIHSGRLAAARPSRRLTSSRTRSRSTRPTGSFPSDVSAHLRIEQAHSQQVRNPVTQWHGSDGAPLPR